MVLGFDMAGSNNTLKIHEHCVVAPPSTTATEFSLPLTLFDLLWLRLHPVEGIFFYSLQSDPSFFYDTVVPKLKTSLSVTLQHFYPLAGNIVWPSDSRKPIIKYTPGDGVSVIIAEHSGADFNQIIDNSPRDAVDSRLLLPHLDTSDPLASVISLQITLFPNRGFCIGISAHHAVLDGKSSIMFIKAWASLCKSTIGEQSSSSLLPELEPLFDREIIKDPDGLETVFINYWEKFSSMFGGIGNANERSLEILYDAFPPIMQHTVRATYELTSGDLEKIRKLVSAKWDMVDDGEKCSIPSNSKPPTYLSTFVLACAYVSVCIAKAVQEFKSEKQKFALVFPVDCRARLEPQVPENYFGNCVLSHLIDTQWDDFTKEDGVVIVAKKVHGKIKMLVEGVLDGAETLYSKYESCLKEGVEVIAVAGSTRFGVYGCDFGWGRPAKVEIASVDRALTIGMTESKSGKGGVEVGLVLNKRVMDLFGNLLQAGLCSD